jgi:ABC-2 type transport system permease protein
MFWQIFLFEIKYRLKRPDTYLYFLFFLLATILAFSNGWVPGYRAAYFNAPQVISKFFAALSFFMMVVTASIMGAPLYRDLEYSTHEYYLSYPITKNGYFWGRFLGSFLFVVIIASTMIWGALIGIHIGPKLGWIASDRVGPDHFLNYVQPFFVFALPNLLLTSSLFFGLVAHARNIKAIYTGATILYVGYMLALFIFQNLLKNSNYPFYLDPFCTVPLEQVTNLFTPAQ